MSEPKHCTCELCTRGRLITPVFVGDPQATIFYEDFIEGVEAMSRIDPKDDTRPARVDESSTADQYPRSGFVLRGGRTQADKDEEARAKAERDRKGN